MSKEKSLKDHVANLKSTMISQTKMFMAIHNLEEVEFKQEITMFQPATWSPIEMVPCIAEYLVYHRVGTSLEGTLLLKGRDDNGGFNWNIESCSVEEIADVLDSLLEKRYSVYSNSFEGANNPLVTTFNEKISRGLV